VNARDLARALAAAKAEWELIPEGIPFPGEREHAEACERLSVRSSDPSTWSPEARRLARQDLQRRLAAKGTVVPRTPASEPGRDQDAKIGGGRG
jgi:hypothetical protein